MKKANLVAVALAALLSVPAQAEETQVRIYLPWVVPPPMIEIEPGVQVMPDYDGELFFVSGWYWIRLGGRWGRARNLRSPFTYMAAAPPALSRLPPGRYRRWRAEKRAVVKQEMKAVRQEAKREGKGSGHGGKGGKK